MTDGSSARDIRLRLDLGYDGSAFAGWAAQPDQRTVQGVVERALTTVLRLDPPARLTVAGRTDAGVHAWGQVAHVDVPASVWEAAGGTLIGRLAGVLPADVRVRHVGPAAQGFDARFSALSRRYTYRVSDDPGGADPLRRHDTLWHRRPLDVDRMNAACQRLIGEHDFAAYCRRRVGATTVRRLLRVEWRRLAGETGEDGVAPAETVVATVEADAFCHSMVRALVGASLAVGDGRRATSWPAEVLQRGVRDSAVWVVPAHGLCLDEVRYPADGELAARVRETRRVRTLSSPEHRS